MKKIVLGILLWTCATPAFAQATSEITLRTKDQHYSTYTSAVLNSDGSFFVTADEMGKIMLTDLKTFESTQTLRNSSNFHINENSILNLF